MPKPFLYFVDFINSPATSDEQDQNRDSIRGMLAGNNVAMSIYAQAAIIAAAMVTSALDPAAITLNWQCEFDGTDWRYYQSQGLWQKYDQQADGETQCEWLIVTLTTGQGWHIKDDGSTTLAAFLASDDNAELCRIFITNYTCGALDTPLSLQTAAMQMYCRNQYRIALTYLQTEPIKLSSVALAILARKKRKRWWK